MCSYIFAPAYAKNSDKEAFKNVHSKILEDEDGVLLDIVSQDIDEPMDAEVLLQEIIKLWVTIRGYSIAGHWMEVHE